jgi:hypothetical protein
MGISCIRIACGVGLGAICAVGAIVVVDVLVSAIMDEDEYKKLETALRAWESYEKKTDGILEDVSEELSYFIRLMQKRAKKIARSC